VHRGQAARGLDLHHAADVAGRDHIGIERTEGSRLADAELRGEFKAAVRGDSAWKASVRHMAEITSPDNEKSRNDAANKTKTTPANELWKQKLPGAARKGA